MLDNTQSIICAFGLASAAPRSPYRHLELCGIAFILSSIPQALIAIIAGGFAVVVQLAADVPEPALQVPILFAEQLVGTFALFFQLIRTGQQIRVLRYFLITP
ncbi:hypothetical protein [Gemmiger qucibialis]|uniref:hypothetical protein n=1 Tax=Gemmiger qucibialis TaxID=2997294 RepID=UPI0022DF77A7|nr:hypothetical protein [Gemmiger qucibialis]